MVTYSELFQYTLVLLGLAGLVFEICEHRNGKRK